MIASAYVCVYTHTHTNIHINSEVSSTPMMEAAYTCTRLHGVTSHEANLQFKRRSRVKKQTYDDDDDDDNIFQR